ncbi:hypothetical protein QR674_07760 [Acinetobacter chinensis]|uniref:Uncharacterized protein n=1 Tax=Acinetobacter chinensis TaxID=2004650 RepID=A0ABU3WFQ0_9GAMM|nr:hypothetical protein [Acinetobacter chinensis]MDV2468878.1 hypothetical protein [Acinetobacter chinensis]
MNKGDRISVEFISESATEFSGTKIEGTGTVDRFDNGYVYGQLDNGQPFMCPEQFVCVINQDAETEFRKWIEALPEYQTLIFRHGERLFIRCDGQYEILTIRLARRLWVIIEGHRFVINALGETITKYQEVERGGSEVDLDS